MNNTDTKAKLQTPVHLLVMVVSKCTNDSMKKNWKKLLLTFKTKLYRTNSSEPNLRRKYLLNVSQQN